MPQLDDDALVYSLHDFIGEEDLEDAMSGVTFGASQAEPAQPPQRDYHLSRDPRPDNPIYRIAEMQQRVKNAEKDLQNHKQLLASDMQLQGRLNNGLGLEETTLEPRNSPQQGRASDTETEPDGNISTTNGNTDSSYFASYSGHGKCSFDLVR